MDVLSKGQDFTDQSAGKMEKTGLIDCSRDCLQELNP